VSGDREGDGQAISRRCLAPGNGAYLRPLATDYIPIPGWLETVVWVGRRRDFDRGGTVIGGGERVGGPKAPAAPVAAAAASAGRWPK
jgi:hypothetical protein